MATKRPVKSEDLLLLLRVIRRMAVKCSIYYKRCDTALDKQGEKYAAAFELGGRLHNVVDHGGDDPPTPGLFQFNRILSHTQDPRDWGATKDRPWEELYFGYRDAGVVEIFHEIAKKRIWVNVAKMFKQEAPPSVIINESTSNRGMLEYSAEELARTPKKWKHVRITGHMTADVPAGVVTARMGVPRADGLVPIDQVEVDMVMEQASFHAMMKRYKKHDPIPVYQGREGKVRLTATGTGTTTPLGWVTFVFKPLSDCRVRVRVKDRQAFVLGAT